jgi:hypothetical protein
LRAHQELRLKPSGEPDVVHIRVLIVSGDRIYRGVDRPIEVRTKSAAVSSELAPDVIACARGTPGKYTSERFQTKIRTSLRGQALSYVGFPFSNALRQ